MAEIDLESKAAVDRVDNEHSKFTIRALIDNANNVDELEYIHQHIEMLLRDSPQTNESLEGKWIYERLIQELAYCEKRAKKFTE